MRHLGIDYGSKKIGLALSDEAGTMGFPHSIIPNTPKAIEHICGVMAKEDVRALVIGDSVNHAGEPNPVAGGAQALGEEVAARCGVPVFYEWEGFTSAQARRAPAKEPKTRAPKARTDVDASAAALILTSYLSRSSAH
ncbi:MAG: Holliday junction resolvase RuvX [bacterium]|nr:Holliday junction resolvase RuvX [bacterium]